MKTLAVLSALATLAIAAPTHEEYTDSTHLSPSDFTIRQQREKKSTQLEILTEKTPQHFEDHVLEKTSSKLEPSNSVARTFSGFKKPIIVKKKIGYHLYRDSDEEQADPRESCRKQIKVKLCDDNNSMDKMKTASIDEHHEEISEDEMEHSITMAKEAVETFQRDLQKLEHVSGENINHRHTQFGSDTEFHEDIEKARQALEHIQRKFKNLDAVTNSAGGRISDIHINTPKSEDELLAQWKDAGNHHKSHEIAKNQEDNFKSTDEHDMAKQFKFEPNNVNDEEKDFKSTTIEDIETSSNFHGKFEDGITSIVEDKVPHMKIQSDNLIKGTLPNEGVHEKEEKLSKIDHEPKEQKEMIEKQAELNKHENINHTPEVQETKERHIEDKENKMKSVEMQEDDKLSRSNVDGNENFKLNDVSHASHNHGEADLQQELHKAHLHTKSVHDNDQVMHESKNVKTISSIQSEKSTHFEDVAMINEHNNKNKIHLHDDLESKIMLPKNTESLASTHEHKHMKNVDNTHIPAMTMKSVEHDMKNEDGIHFDSLRSSLPITTSRLNNEGNHEKLGHNNKDNHLTTEHRASSDINKEILNNMDFVDDSHSMALHHPSLTKADHILNSEKSELHERLNLPDVQPNSEHLHTMMHFSDNAHLVSPHLKMASMFNNEQPNINVQFNTPQDFEEQTNVQELMPFRTTSDTHHNPLLNTGLEETFHHMHDEEIPTHLHDPLKIRWAHDTNPNSEKLNAASHLHQENMRMDGSSQHFNIEKFTPTRGNLMDDHLLSLNEQMGAQQRWAQAKTTNNHQSASMNSRFEPLHHHEKFVSRNNDHTMMMHQKSNIDSSMQPSSFTQMRGVPKMALEYTNPNQWSHNHGSFRSSYGPGISTSYGSAGGSAYGGSAVGVFPNANVGNCAVPLLLSCSPSVVSGSLAKTQNSYNAPSYRSEDMNYLKKRGIDRDEVSPGLNLQRLTQLGHRPNVILEKKS